MVSDDYIWPLSFVGMDNALFTDGQRERRRAFEALLNNPDDWPDVSTEALVWAIKATEGWKPSGPGSPFMRR